MALAHHNNLAETWQKQKSWYDWHVKAQTYEVGQKVKVLIGRNCIGKIGKKTVKRVGGTI